MDDAADTLALNASVKEVTPTTHTLRELHRTIKKVGEDTEGLRFNTAIAAMMEFVNHLTKLGLQIGRKMLETPRAPKTCVVTGLRSKTPFCVSQR